MSKRFDLLSGQSNCGPKVSLFLLFRAKSIEQSINDWLFLRKWYLFKRAWLFGRCVLGHASRSRLSILPECGLVDTCQSFLQSLLPMVIPFYFFVLHSNILFALKSKTFNLKGSGLIRAQVLRVVLYCSSKCRPSKRSHRLAFPFGILE